MNDIDDASGKLPDDWQALTADWRSQPGSTLDFAALAQEIRRRGRRLRWAWISEIATLVVTLALAIWVMSSTHAGTMPRVLIVTLMAVALAFQGWALWIRRAQVREAALDADAMISLDIERTRTTLRYWRVSTWVAVAMWLALYAAAWSRLTSQSPADAVMTHKLVHSVLATGVIGFGTAVWAWRWCRHNQRRLARMLSLRHELRKE